MQYQFAGGHATLRQPVSHRARAFFQRCGCAIFFRAQREKQVTRHQIIGVLVETGENFGQRYRGKRHERNGSRRLVGHGDAAERTADLRPQPAKNQIECGSGIKQIERQRLFSTTTRVTPTNLQRHALPPRHSRSDRIFPVTAPRCVLQAHLRIERHAWQDNIRRDLYTIPHWLQAQGDGIEIGQ